MTIYENGMPLERLQPISKCKDHEGRLIFIFKVSKAKFYNNRTLVIFHEFKEIKGYYAEEFKEKYKKGIIKKIDI